METVMHRFDGHDDIYLGGSVELSRDMTTGTVAIVTDFDWNGFHMDNDLHCLGCEQLLALHAMIGHVLEHRYFDGPVPAVRVESVTRRAEVPAS